MDSFEEFTPGITVINIVSLVATFLLNTDRALSCIKLSKECLVLGLTEEYWEKETYTSKLVTEWYTS